VDAGDDLGLGERQEVVVALEVARPVLEPLAAVALLGGPVALDGRAHGSVDHRDPVAEDRSELLRDIGTEIGRGRQTGLLCWGLLKRRNAVHRLDRFPKC
jgi:hypothetical protein